MQLKWLHILVSAQIWTLAVCQSYYTILAPGSIKPNRKYSVSLTLHAAVEPATIRMGILRTPFLFNFQDVLLQPFQTKIIDFDLTELNGDYELIAEGLEGLIFKNSTKLLVDAFAKPLKVYMQTSKGVFKPGDLVKFRIIVLDAHLRPVKLKEPIKVQIMDANNYRVKQFKDINLNKGMFSESIQLSEQPNMGIWKIIVSISGKYNMREMKTFEVLKYNLPKFSVHIDTVDDFIHEDEILKVTVYGKYVYGRYVEDGTVTVKIMILKHVFEMQTKEIENNKANFEFNITKYFYSAEQEPNFDVLAILNEKYSNVSSSIKKNVQHHNQRYKIVVPMEEIEFRDNQPYLIKAKVLYLNNTEINDRTTPIFMKHGSDVYRSLLDDHGLATFIFNAKIAESYEFYFKKTSMHLSNLFYNGGVSEDSLCNLKLKPGKIQWDKMVEVVLSSKSYIPYFVYTLMGHGNIVHTKFVELKTDQNSYTIRIEPTLELVPRTVLCVHYIDKGKLNYCDITIGFPHEFKNKINITTFNNTVEPGEEVTLKIQAQPQTRVGLLAIDLSAHLFNSNYSLNKNEIIKSLFDDMSYVLQYNQFFGNIAGLVIFTNADINIVPMVISGIIPVGRPNPRSAISIASPQLMRTKFPETWIFKEIDILDENTTLTINIPDTITTWLVTAISIHEDSGFGMMDIPLNITVFRSVFISLNLPYSIKRGEIVNIPATVFNYNEQNLSCELIMENTESDYRFLDEENNILNLTQAIREMNVTANKAANTIFKIQALKLGQLNIQLSVSSNSLLLDAVVQQLKVEPEGILINDNQGVFLNLQQGVVKSSYFKAYIPQDIVSESEFLRLSIGGDSMLPSLENLNKLVQMPTGCGEQNMINFAPNILVLDYLKVIDKWETHKELVAKALGFIEIGYQRELTFRHNSGGFSVFGSGSDESTWLTAYVIRFFIKAVKYVAIEPAIITSGLDFLVYHQLSNGEFQHRGHLFYSALKNRYGFTAFVLLSFMENRTYRKRYAHVIQNGLDFLTQNLDNIDDTYALSIMAVTFRMAEHDKLTDIRNKLLTMQNQDLNHKWWSASDKTQSNDVEISAYALMGLLDTEGIDCVSIFRWIIEQRKENGGFATTHETVVGLQALIKFSEKSNSETPIQDILINITYSAQNEQGQEVKSGGFEITQDNCMILQRHELPHTTRSIQYEATGQGNSLLQFSYQYYVKEKQRKSYTAEENVTLVMPLETVSTFRRSDSLQLKSVPKKLRSIMAPQRVFFITPTAKMKSENEMLMEICFKYQPSKDLQIQKN